MRRSISIISSSSSSSRYTTPIFPRCGLYLARTSSVRTKFLFGGGEPFFYPRPSHANLPPRNDLTPARTRRIRSGSLTSSANDPEARARARMRGKGSRSAISTAILFNFIIDPGLCVFRLNQRSARGRDRLKTDTNNNCRVSCKFEQRNARTS